jgi:hypothetical protein
MINSSVPHHLRHLVPLASLVCHEFSFEAPLRCECASRTFQWFTQNKFLGPDQANRPADLVVNGIPYFRIECVCAACFRRSLVFDAHLHGWNGFVCRDNSLATMTRPELVKWFCHSCKSDEFLGRVGVASEGPDDFHASNLRSGLRLQQEDWVDAFGWIRIGLTCQSCSLDLPHWVDYEAM